MAQTTTYAFEFRGLNEGVAKLTTINRLIDNIASKSNGINFGGNTNSSAPKASNSVGNISTVAMNLQLAQLSKYLDAIGDIISKFKVPNIPEYLQKSGLTLNKSITSKSGRLPDNGPAIKIPVEHEEKPYKVHHVNISQGGTISTLSQSLRKLKEMFNKNKFPEEGGGGGGNVSMNPMFNPSFYRPLINEVKRLLRTILGDIGTIGSEFKRDISILKENIFPKSWGLSKHSGIWNVLRNRGEGNSTIVPPTKGHSSPSGNWVGGTGTKFYGGLPFMDPDFLKPFGKRLSNMFSGFGKGGKEIGGTAARLIGGHELGKLAMEFGKLGLVVGGIIAGLFGLKKGIEEVTAAYETAAKRGLQVNVSENIDNAFKTIGASTPNLSQIATQLGHGNDSDVILRAARGGQLGDDSQQLLNMANDFKSAMKDSAGAAKQIEESSRAAYLVNYQATQVGIQFKSTLSQFTEAIAPILTSALFATKEILKISNTFSIMSLATSTLKYTGFFNKPDFKQQFPGSGASPASTNSFEKLGFVMNAASPEKNLTDINKNTSATVGWLEKISNALSGKDKGQHMQHYSTRNLA